MREAAFVWKCTVDRHKRNVSLLNLGQANRKMELNESKRGREPAAKFYVESMSYLKCHQKVIVDLKGDTITEETRMGLRGCAPKT